MSRGDDWYHRGGGVGKGSAAVIPRYTGQKRTLLTDKRDLAKEDHHKRAVKAATSPATSLPLLPSNHSNHSQFGSCD